MKKATLLAVFLVWIPAALALDICEDSIPVTQACQMLTPMLNCAEYNYSVFTLTGELADSGSLSVLNGSAYYFNFSLGEGDYLVVLCDGSSREISVSEDHPKMWYLGFFWVALLLGYLIARGKSGGRIHLLGLFQMLVGVVFAVSMIAYNTFFAVIVALGAVAAFAVGMADKQ